MRFYLEGGEEEVEYEDLTIIEQEIATAKEA